MRHFRFFLAALALMLTTSTFANFNSDEGARWGSISFEIERMLNDSDLIIENDFTVTVLFEVTEDKRIVIQKISSPNEKVNEFLKQRLENQKLKGASWFTDKLYELPVKVQSRR